MNKALLVIDLQNDFLPNGSLEVPNSGSIIPVINKVQKHFDLIVASQDWHPQNHMSFASNHKDKKPFDTIPWKDSEQILWPNHCVQGTEGAAFHKDLDTKNWETIFRKGTDPSVDSYSMFYDNGKMKSTGLKGYLEEKKVGKLYFCGLAADVCVYYSVKDALEFGFSCIVIEDAIKELDPTVYKKQKQELINMGVEFLQSESFL